MTRAPSSMDDMRNVCMAYTTQDQVCKEFDPDGRNKQHTHAIAQNAINQFENTSAIPLPFVSACFNPQVFRQLYVLQRLA